MPYLGDGTKSNSSNFRLLDDISNQFDGNKVLFNMTEAGSGVSVHSVGATFITVNGILLRPKTDYQLNSDLQSILFTTAPKNGDSFTGRVVETSGITIPDNSITPEKLSNDLHRPGKQSIDVASGSTAKSFTLSESIENEEEISVYVDGLYQRPKTHYTVLGNMLTFDEAPAGGSEIDIVYNIARTGATAMEITDGINTTTTVKNEVNNLRTCVETLSSTVNTNEAALGSRGGIQWIFNEQMMTSQQCSAHPTYNNSCEIANGKCCHWTVPANVCCVVFEIWGGGGGGAGMTCCNCCSYGQPAGGGNYALKSIQTKPGCQYTVCAGGTYPCCHHHGCTSGHGCPSYVTGYNLASFCVMGGCLGIMCNGSAHGHVTASICANNPDGNHPCISFGADFSIAGTTGTNTGNTCHCWKKAQIGGTAPLIGVFGHSQITEYWCMCACFVPGFGAGGLSGDSTYCDNNAKCCAAGNMGGPGLVRITYF